MEMDFDDAVKAFAQAVAGKFTVDVVEERIEFRVDRRTTLEIVRLHGKTWQAGKWIDFDEITSFPLTDGPATLMAGVTRVFEIVEKTTVSEFNKIMAGSA